MEATIFIPEEVRGGVTDVETPKHTYSHFYVVIRIPTTTTTLAYISSILEKVPNVHDLQCGQTIPMWRDICITICDADRREVLGTLVENLFRLGVRKAEVVWYTGIGKNIIKTRLEIYKKLD